ncbi:hypothetical protein MY5147_001164 [Beauveria neobassiana]
MRLRVADRRLARGPSRQKASSAAPSNYVMEEERNGGGGVLRYVAMGNNKVYHQFQLPSVGQGGCTNPLAKRNSGAGPSQQHEGLEVVRYRGFQWADSRLSSLVAPIAVAVRHAK